MIHLSRHTAEESYVRKRLLEIEFSSLRIEAAANQLSVHFTAHNGKPVRAILICCSDRTYALIVAFDSEPWRLAPVEGSLPEMFDVWVAWLEEKLLTS